MPADTTGIIPLSSFEQGHETFSHRVLREVDVLLATLGAFGSALVWMLGVALLVRWLWGYEDVGDYAAAVAVPLITAFGSAVFAGAALHATENTYGLGLFAVALTTYPTAWLARGWAQDATFPSWPHEHWLDWVTSIRAAEISALPLRPEHYTASEALITVVGGVTLAYWWHRMRNRPAIGEPIARGERAPSSAPAPSSALPPAAPRAPSREVSALTESYVHDLADDLGDFESL